MDYLSSYLTTIAKSGAQYTMVMFCEASNYIHVETLRSRSGNDITDAYRRATSFWTLRGIIPEYLRLDNETSAQLAAFCANERVSMEYVPPGSKCTNKAERAIATWKAHFIAGFATTDPSFPI